MDGGSVDRRCHSLRATDDCSASRKALFFSGSSVSALPPSEWGISYQPKYHLPSDKDSSDSPGHVSFGSKKTPKGFDTLPFDKDKTRSSLNKNMSRGRKLFLQGESPEWPSLVGVTSSEGTIAFLRSLPAPFASHRCYNNSNSHKKENQNQRATPEEE